MGHRPIRILQPGMRNRNLLYLKRLSDEELAPPYGSGPSIAFSTASSCLPPDTSLSRSPLSVSRSAPSSCHCLLLSSPAPGWERGMVVVVVVEGGGKSSCIWSVGSDSGVAVRERGRGEGGRGRVGEGGRGRGGGRGRVGGGGKGRGRGGGEKEG